MKIQYYREDRYGSIHIRTVNYDHRFTIIPRVGEWVNLSGEPSLKVDYIVHIESTETVEIYLRAL